MATLNKLLHNMEKDNLRCVGNTTKRDFVSLARILCEMALQLGVDLKREITE